MIMVASNEFIFTPIVIHACKRENQKDIAENKLDCQSFAEPGLLDDKDQCFETAYTLGIDDEIPYDYALNHGYLAGDSGASYEDEHQAREMCQHSETDRW